MRKISIIIPVYNNPEELRLTLNAILRQDFPLEDLEVLVVDDGSAVDMESVAGEYSRFMAVWYFWQEDRGFRPGSARNMGIRAAEGELCVFLDCGVIVTSGCLAEHYRLYQENGIPTVIIGYIYGNDTHSDLNEMRKIIDSLSPDEAAKVMEEKGMTDGREKNYALFGDKLADWPAPWTMLWSLHFSVPTAFMRNNDIYFDEYFSAWGCEDNDFGIQLHRYGGVFLLGRNARAIHYPPEMRSYDKLHNDPEFRAKWLKNKQYLREKYCDNTLVLLWLDKGVNEVNLSGRESGE